MGDLTPFIPQESETVRQIFAWHKERGDAEPARGYLGASIIGHECDRFLWYTFRGCAKEEFEGRLYRLFKTGDLEEVRFVEELRAIGCTVHDVDEDGRQFEASDLGGHFSGHMDGVALGVPEAPKTWHLCEFKTAKDKLFDTLKKEGVQGAYPRHWAQMQVYMGQANLTRALYLSKAKDTDRLYSERVKFDSSAYKTLMARAARIIRATQAPERMASRPDDWRCKFCCAKPLCWGDGGEIAVPIPAQGCKSCCHSTPETEQEGAVWSCAQYNTVLEDTAAGAECPSHLLLPGLVSFADPHDAGDNWIEFESRDGTRWKHGPGPGSYSTEELMSSAAPSKQGRKHVPWSCDEDSDSCDRAWCAKHDGTLFLCAVCDQAEAELEPECPGPPFVSEEPTGLIDSYPWGDSERLWDGPSSELAGVLEQFGYPPELLNTLEPSRSQEDKQVTGVEYRLDGQDYLIVLYKQDDQAAIWRGKE